MGIELHPTILSLIKRKRYQRSKSQLVLSGAKHNPAPHNDAMMLTNRHSWEAADV